jgi:hypothetical protein
MGILRVSVVVVSISALFAAPVISTQPITPQVPADPILDTDAQVFPGNAQRAATKIGANINGLQEQINGLQHQLQPDNIRTSLGYFAPYVMYMGRVADGEIVVQHTGGAAGIAGQSGINGRNNPQLVVDPINKRMVLNFDFGTLDGAVVLVTPHPVQDVPLIATTQGNQVIIRVGGGTEGFAGGNLSFSYLVMRFPESTDKH